MTSWLDGELLSARATVSAALRRDLGATLARLNVALRGLRHPGARRTHLWDLQNFWRLRALLGELPGDGLLPEVAAGRWPGAGAGCPAARAAGRARGLPGPVRRRGPARPGARPRAGHPHRLPRRQPARRRRADHRHPRLRRRAHRAGRDGRRRRRLLPARHRAATCSAPALDVVAGYHARRPARRRRPGPGAEFIVARVAARIIVSQWNAMREPANRGYLLRRTPQAIEHFAALRLLTPDEIARRLRRGACGHVRCTSDRASARHGQRLRRLAAADLPPATRELLAPARARARRRVPAVLRPAGVVRPRLGRLPVRPGGQRLPRRLQQRAVGRALPPPRHRGGQPGSSRRSTRTPGTSPTGVVAYAERLLATHDLGAPAHAMFTCTGSEANDLALRIARHYTGGDRDDRHRQRLPRGDRRARRALPQPRPERPARRRTSGRSPRPSAGVNFTAAVAWAISDLRTARPAARRVPRRLAVLLRRRAARPRRASSRRSPRSCAPRAGSTSPTRSSPGSPGPARTCGATSGTGWHPTSSPWASRWATACRSPGSSPGGTSSTTSGAQAPVLQHLRRQPRLRRRRLRRPRRPRRRGAARQRGRDRRVPRRTRSPGSRRSSPRARRRCAARACTSASTSIDAGDRRAVRRARLRDRQRDAGAPRPHQRDRARTAACSRSGRRSPSAASTPTSSSRSLPTSFPSRALRVSKDLREAASESRQLRLPAAPRPREIKARSPSPHAS